MENARRSKWLEWILLLALAGAVMCLYGAWLAPYFERVLAWHPIVGFCVLALVLIGLFIGAPAVLAMRTHRGLHAGATFRPRRAIVFLVTFAAWNLAAIGIAVAFVDGGISALVERNGAWLPRRVLGASAVSAPIASLGAPAVATRVASLAKTSAQTSAAGEVAVQASGFVDGAGGVDTLYLATETGNLSIVQTAAASFAGSPAPKRALDVIGQMVAVSGTRRDPCDSPCLIKASAITVVSTERWGGNLEGEVSGSSFVLDAILPGRQPTATRNVAVATDAHTIWLPAREKLKKGDLVFVYASSVTDPVIAHVVARGLRSTATQPKE